MIDLGGQTIIFDTFLTTQAAQDLKLAAKQLTGNEPSTIINSHYHNDHIWGNQVFSPHARFISSNQTRKLIQTEGKEELKWERENSSQKLKDFCQQYEQAEDEKQRHELSLWVGYYQGLVEDLPHLKVRLPDLTFEKHLILHGSSRALNLIAFEGAHTANDAILHLPDDGIIFMSDLLFVGCHPYLAECDIQKLLSALKEIAKLGAKTYVPGHGPVGSHQNLVMMTDYISMCMDKAQELVANGKITSDEIQDVKIPEKYDSWEHSRFYHINLQALCKRIGAQ